MTNADDPVLMTQKKLLDKEVKETKAQMKADPDNEDLVEQLETQKAEMAGVNEQLKTDRKAMRKASDPPDPHSPELLVLHNELNQKIVAKKAEIFGDPNNETLKEQLADLEARRATLNRQMAPPENDEDTKS